MNVQKIDLTTLLPCNPIHSNDHPCFSEYGIKEKILQNCKERCLNFNQWVLHIDTWTYKISY